MKARIPLIHKRQVSFYSSCSLQVRIWYLLYFPTPAGLASKALFNCFSTFRLLTSISLPVITSEYNFSIVVVIKVDYTFVSDVDIAFNYPIAFVAGQFGRFAVFFPAQMSFA